MLVNVQTKFNIGDTAYKFNPRTMKLEPFEIKRICAFIDEEKGLSVSYTTSESYQYASEKELFVSKEEFIARL